MTNEELAELERRMADECLVDLPIQVESLRNHAAERKRNGWLKSSHNLAAAANVIEALAPFHNAAPSLIATAREAEALRVENARLREALFNAIALIGHSVPMDATALVAGELLTAHGVWHQGRAALEQGEVK